MAARALWKGRLVLGKEALPVRLYSAVRDTTVHFRLLDRHGLARVRQRIVRKTDHAEVPRAGQRKALVLEAGRAVVFSPGELEALEPEASRDIGLARFVRPALLGAQWYERPYYLGPGSDRDAKRYFALAAALSAANLIGIARWVMRKTEYVGALAPLDGHLVLVTLRRAEQILSVPELQIPRAAEEKEVKLAAQLVEAFAGGFDPRAWQDEYHRRVCELIEAKAKGRKVKARAPKRKPQSRDLAAALRRSIAAARKEAPAHA